MDFKVIGTEKGITALQMDLKGQELSRGFFQAALDQAQDALLHILGEMKNQTLDQKSLELNSHAPAFGSVSIPRDMIGSLIGSGGKTIKGICEATDSKIDIDDNGNVSIMAKNQKMLEETLRRIGGFSQKPEIGKTYEGKVISLRDFGAFVDLGLGKDGLLHISEISDKRTESIESALQEGERIRVKILDIDEKGRIKLTKKGADQ
jgi:polyribonucleotide nucleotidyltransferase